MLLKQNALHTVLRLFCCPFEKSNSSNPSHSIHTISNKQAHKQPSLSFHFTPQASF